MVPVRKPVVQEHVTSSVVCLIFLPSTNSSPALSLKSLPFVGGTRTTKDADRKGRPCTTPPIFDIVIGENAHWNDCVGRHVPRALCSPSWF